MFFLGLFIFKSYIINIHISHLKHQSIMISLHAHTMKTPWLWTSFKNLIHTDNISQNKIKNIDLLKVEVIYYISPLKLYLAPPSKTFTHFLVAFRWRNFLLPPHTSMVELSSSQMRHIAPSPSIDQLGMRKGPNPKQISRFKWRKGERVSEGGRAEKRVVGQTRPMNTNSWRQ